MLQCDFPNFIEIELRNECSSINLLYIFRTLFPKNNYGELLTTESVFGVTLVRIFPGYLSVFSPNAEKCGPE